MMMDIACPAEMLNFEQENFGDTRRQAYLTFLNESAYVITALSGTLILLDKHGQPLEERRTSFGGFFAPPGQRFVCHLALDGYPDFSTAEMIIEDIVFNGEEPWALHPLRLKNYDPPVLPAGPERNALVAVAGHDAVCYPSQNENTWLCVCGRYNRGRWPTCRRCRRQRDETLATYTPEKVKRQYGMYLKQAAQDPPRILLDPARRKRPRPQEADAPTPESKAKSKPKQPASHRWITLALCVLVAGMLIWGLASMAARLPKLPGNTEQPFLQDYLDPVS